MQGTESHANHSVERGPGGRPDPGYMDQDPEHTAKLLRAPNRDLGACLYGQVPYQCCGDEVMGA